MTMLVLGATGYVGRNLCAALRAQSVKFVAGHSASHPLPPDGWNPNEHDCIVNCAGLADLDRAVSDPPYALRMLRANAIGPIALAKTYSGYLVHVSSPLALFDATTYYAGCKRATDDVLRCRPKPKLIAYPGQLYGGAASSQLDWILRTNQDKPLVIDNVRLFSPTHTPTFCDRLARLIQERRTGRVLIYGQPAMTALDLAYYLNLWSAKWRAGEYVDPARRPRNTSLDTVVGRGLRITFPVDGP